MSKKEAIERIEAAEEELRLAKEVMGGVKETYRLGDKFKCNDSSSMLVSNGDGKVVMVYLRNGKSHKPGVAVKDYFRITEEELDEICRCRSKERY